MNKIFQNLKMERESIKKTLIKEVFEKVKNSNRNWRWKLQQQKK